MIKNECTETVNLTKKIKTPKSIPDQIRGQFGDFWFSFSTENFLFLVCNLNCIYPHIFNQDFFFPNFNPLQHQSNKPQNNILYLYIQKFKFNIYRERE